MFESESTLRFAGLQVPSGPWPDLKTTGRLTVFTLSHKKILSNATSDTFGKMF